MGRLEGRVAIVTGASANIGGALARGLAAEGARVVCTDIVEEVAIASAAKVTESGGEAIAVAGDVTDEAHPSEVVSKALKQWGRVDILVNNAVMFKQNGLFTMALSDYRRQLDVILTGAFLFTRAAAESMITAGTGGSVINILSTAAWQGVPGNIGYATAKSGLINFTRSTAMELAGHNIRVNGLTPTATHSDDPAVVARVEAIHGESTQWPVDALGQIPMGRLPRAEDYVGAAVFLASDDSAMITGSNITVDGGGTAKYWQWVPHTNGI